MRKYSCIQVSARSEYCCKWSAEMLVEAKVASGSSAVARASAYPLPPPRNTATTSKCKIPLSISARRRIHLEIPTVDNPKIPLPENRRSTQFLYQVCQNYRAQTRAGGLTASHEDTMSLDTSIWRLNPKVGFGI